MFMFSDAFNPRRPSCLTILRLALFFGIAVTLAQITTAQELASTAPISASDAPLAQDLRGTPGSITVVKQAVPESTQGFGFSGTNGIYGFTLVDDGTNANTMLLNNLAAGTYVINESLPTGWDFDSVGCIDNSRQLTVPVEVRRGTSPSVTVALSEGQHMVCTFNNIQQGSITITKDASPESSQQFSFTGTLGAFSLVDDGVQTPSVTFSGLSADDYTVDEVVPAGWELTDVSCTSDLPDDRRIPDPTNLEVILRPGENLDCTFFNVDLRVDLEITKEVTFSDGQADGLVEYEIVVSNAGPADAEDVLLEDVMPAELINVSWTCAVDTGTATCDNDTGSETGTGDLQETIDLASNSSLLYTVIGTVASGFVGEIVNEAQLTLDDETIDSSAGNNQASAAASIGTILSIPTAGGLAKSVLAVLLLISGIFLVRRPT